MDLFELEQRALGEDARLLSDESLQSLRHYQYSGVDLSLARKYVLNPFYARCLEYLPTWLAPNAVTLIGISAIVFCNLLVILFQGGDLETPMPAWVYFVFAISLFFYQTMDNLDGKQARRTGTSSPLGELFDHGIDSLNCLWGAMLNVSTCGQGSSKSALVNIVGPMTGMYLSDWETYYTKTLFLGYLNAPNEGLFVAMAFHLVAAFCGGAFWLQPLSADPTSFWHSFHRGDLWTCVLNATLLTMHIPTCVSNVLRGASSADRKARLLSTWPLLAIIAAIFVWCTAPNSTIVSADPAQGHVYLLGWCLSFTFGRVSTTIILSHLCESKHFPKLSFPVLLLFGGAFWYGVLGRFGVSWAPLSEAAYLWVYLVLSGAYFFGFAAIVIDRITEYLGIRAFTIPS